jgi:mono/diheme cytochrome c family protein
MRTSILLIVLPCLLAAASVAQKPTINPVPVKPTSWASGKQMFQEYCAACHGEKARGDGPAAPACKAKPADLTGLASSNGGKFPYNRFYAVMSFGVLLPTPAHGSADMPVWLPVLSSLNPDREAIAEQRMHNLAGYVASLQQSVNKR